MFNEASVWNAFRALVSEVPYRSVSVTLLCERAGVSRKAFYQHYSGKDDVLRAIVSQATVAPELELHRLLTFEKMSAHAPETLRRIFRAVANDANFYRNLVSTSPEGARAFAEAAHEVFASFDSILLAERGFAGEDWQLEYAASYFAEAKAHLMLKWICGGFEASADEVADLYCQLALPFWNTLG